MKRVLYSTHYVYIEQLSCLINLVRSDEASECVRSRSLIERRFPDTFKAQFAPKFPNSLDT